MNIRKIIFIVAGIVFLLVPKLYSQEPVFELKDIDNSLVSYSELKGEKLTVIDFWATWCPPCKRSIPEINELFLEFKDQGVNFIGISIDGPRNQSKLKPFVNSMSLDYTVLRDINSEVMSDMNITSVPTLLVFNSSGELVFLHEGFHPGDKKFIRSEIQKNL